MKIFVSLFLSLLIFNTSFAQNNTIMTLDYGVENKNLQTILMFQDIDFETVNFKKDIKGRSYQIMVKEFRKGKKTKIDTLFNGAQSHYFDIKNDSLSFNLLTKTEKDQLIIQVRGSSFYSKKLIYKALPKNGRFALKDFLGAKKSSQVPRGELFPIFAIITPTVYEDGSASYCNVAESGVEPEKLGKEFNIPHYFIIEMKFK